jgi:hypothetical protein
MGDRVLVQLISGDEVSPVLYGHWSGNDGKEWLNELILKMGDRLDDLSYSFARLVQLAMKNSVDSVISFGVWNATKKLELSDSHGDAGIYILNCKTKEITHLS